MSPTCTIYQTSPNLAVCTNLPEDELLIHLSDHATGKWQVETQTVCPTKEEHTHWVVKVARKQRKES